MAIRPTSNNLAKLEALKSRLLLCIKIGVSKIVIEGDSKIILNAIRKYSTPNWILNFRLSEVLDLLDSFEDTQIQHIYHEGNFKVDHPTNKGVDGDNLHLVKNVYSLKEISH